MIPDHPEDLDTLAGEYVLGTANADQARSVAGALDTRPDLRAAVLAWESRLAPLTALAPPVAPPVDLWPRIETALNAGPASAGRRSSGGTVHVLRRAWGSPGVWRWSAAGAAALAASLAWFAVVPERAPRYLALMAAEGQGQPTWLVESRTRGTVELTPLAAWKPPAGKDLELWSITKGAAPRAVGLVQAGKRLPLPRTTLAGGAVVLAISLEPKGGSPTGAPTGPVLYTGEVRRVD
ncbi:anti-sigma factor [Nitrospirillum iridis]|uniref:Anti-sigma-K factor RskA n=1 Tax=Nitrospirillum iridis TaxID=765888 RepID=A0A7X0AW70_9PROT|nr:anti-sigma factor [Nitrospirillum iridis]MBB6250210.1 anti-sigma-K factor RskA [Nitrospirillum iridis]